VIRRGIAIHWWRINRSQSHAEGEGYVTYVEAECSPDEWLVNYHGASGETPEQFEAKLKSRFEKTVRKAVANLDFMVGLKVASGNWNRITGEMVEKKARAVAFNLVLAKSELRLDVGTPAGTQYKLGGVKVPTDLEGCRNFLENLKNWSSGGPSIVSESDFKAWNQKNPKKPTQYKSYDEMLGKSKSDTEDFKAWAKNNSVARKALDEIENTKKLKPTEAARVNALKAVNASLQTYYKSF
jgi:hypothetical protein